MDLTNELLDAIEIIVRQVVEENTAKIYTGVCKSVYTGSCKMTINGKDNTVKSYGGTPVVGETYRVFVPSGNMSMAFIIVPGAGSSSSDTPATTSYNNLTDRPSTNFVLPSSTSGSTKQFKITVDDSGTISATEYTT